MNLDMAAYYNNAKALYKSPSQQARNMTERWAEDNLYCPKCGRSLYKYPNNMPVFDFYCDHSNEKLVLIPTTRENFQLKSSHNFPKGYFSNKIQGGEYNTTLNSLKRETFPSLVLLHYEKRLLAIEDALLVHRLSITLNCIQPRKPLSTNAIRRGWQGCVISLDKIPKIGHITLVEDSNIVPKNTIIKNWARTTILLEGNINQRGWTADILNLVDQLPKRFDLTDVYECTGKLSKLHPQNKHIKDKIRQQLQILRDHGFIRFVGPGKYIKN